MNKSGRVRVAYLETTGCAAIIGGGYMASGYKRLSLRENAAGAHFAHL